MGKSQSKLIKLAVEMVLLRRKMTHKGGIMDLL